MKRICDFISRYMGVIVLLTAVVSLLLPASFVWVDTVYINPLLGLVMFGMGLTLNPNDFKIVFSRPKDVIIGCLAQFIIMPVMAWVLAKVFHLSPELALGVILVGCCPGGTASNVITYLAKGDLALSVGMTMTSTVLASCSYTIDYLDDGRNFCTCRCSEYVFLHRSGCDTSDSGRFCHSEVLSSFYKSCGRLSSCLLISGNHLYCWHHRIA